ncbi:unnamed protein product [Cunninghamella echinulata]
MNINEFPSEVLEQIFLNLSQSYRIRFSLICKKWYNIINSPTFYHTIELHTIKQAKRFLNFSTTVKIQNQYISQYVNKFIIETTLSNYSAYIDNTFILVLLQRACPSVTEFNYTYVNKSQLISDKSPFYWVQLTQFPLGYTNIEKRCLQYINDKTTKLLELELMKWDEVIEIDDDSLSQSLPNSIQLTVHKRNQIALKRNISDAYPYHDDDDVKVTFTSRTLLLPPLTQLNELYLDFHIYIQKRNMARYELNETTLESLSLSCPSLQKLTLVNFYMNLSNDYLTVLSSYKPQPTINFLHFKSCLFYETGVFDYFSLKYPNLFTFTLTSLKGLPTENENQAMEEYRSSIYHMLIRYKQLNRLKITTMFDKNLNWPTWNTLFDWIIQKPHSFSELELPFEWLSLKDISSHSILKHLTTITLEIKHSFKSILSDILELKNKNGQPYVSTSITTFTIKYRAFQDNLPFYIYQWLASFPRLHTLSLSNLDIKDIDYSQAIDSSSLNRILQQHQQELKEMGPFCSLKKLTILYSKIWLGKNGLSTLCNQCPNINYIYFSDLNIDLPTWDNKNNKICTDFYMDASRLNLDYMYLRHFYYVPILSNDIRLLGNRDIIYIGYVNIRELSTDSKWGYNFGRHQMRYQNSTYVKEKPFTLHITCQSLDRLDIQVYRM